MKLYNNTDHTTNTPPRRAELFLHGELPHADTPRPIQAVPSTGRNGLMVGCRRRATDLWIGPVELTSRCGCRSWMSRLSQPLNCLVESLTRQVQLRLTLKKSTLPTKKKSGGSSSALRGGVFVVWSVLWYNFIYLFLSSLLTLKTISYVIICLFNIHVLFMMFLYFIARSNIHFHFSRLGCHGIQFHALNTFLFVFVSGVQFGSMSLISCSSPIMYQLCQLSI